MALGAGRLTILRMVMTEAVLLVGIGLMLGLAAAVSFGHLAAKLLFGVQPRDPMNILIRHVYSRSGGDGRGLYSRASRNWSGALQPR